MLIDDTDRYCLRRHGRYLKAALKRPHRVLSTCRVNGGLREDLTHIANHQGSEGEAHVVRDGRLWTMGLDAYHRAACAAGALPPESTALMGTAANMQCAVVARAGHADLEVAVAATAGVLTNATRAGDPAGWHEHPDGCRRLSDHVAEAPRGADGHRCEPPEAGAGTIVTLVFLNQPCTPACLVQAATLVTEGKSAAVLDLRMPSLQSSRLATGTGTDQIAIAAPLTRDGEWERHWAGSHNTLGEILGRATHAAVTRCLLLQNGVCPELRRNLCTALGRFGCDDRALREAARAHLDALDADHFERNLTSIIHDPLSAAAAYALAEVLELIQTGVLHADVAHEAILTQTALLAAEVAVDPGQLGHFRAMLGVHRDLAPGPLAALAVVKGFARKWH